MKTWFITGISSGFGRAIAKAAWATGDRVVDTQRNEEQRKAVACGVRITNEAYLVRVLDPIEMAIDRRAADVRHWRGRYWIEPLYWTLRSRETRLRLWF